MKYKEFIVNVCYMLALTFCLSCPIEMTAKDDEWFYRRNSICSFTIIHPEYKFNDEIENIFNNLPLPERFNDHSLGVHSVKFAESDRNDQTNNINNFLRKTSLAQRLVSKWFNRDKKSGSFDMDLVRKRGLYDANQTDVILANKTVRGMAILEDAGEELIPNTYVIFNDVIYKSRSGVGSLLKVLGNVYIGNVDGVNDSMEEIGGFKVTIKSYLYRLKWNDEIASYFYNECYFESSEKDSGKKEYYEQHPELFELEYVGSTSSTASETSFVGVKNANDALRKVCVRVIDRNIADLQKSFPNFRIKTPLLSADPLVADVGLKESINKNSRFEVLSPEVNDKGILIYKRVGIICPIEDKIKDNRYMAIEEQAKNSEILGTEFKKISGGEFYAGMLIREID